MNRSLLLLPLALAAAALPADAGAATLTTYEVVMEGRALTDHRDQVGPDELATVTEGVADVTFTARIPKVQFLDGEPYGVAIPQVLSGGTLEDVRPTRFWQRKRVECTGGECEPRPSSCTYAGLFNPPGGSIVQTRSEDASTVSVQVDVTHGSLVLQMACQGDLYGSGDQHFHLEPEDRGLGTVFSLPKARIGDAVIEHPFYRDFSGPECPNRTPTTTFCNADVRGKVVMRRVAQEERPDDGSRPPAPRPPAPTPGGPVAPGPRPVTPTPAPTVQPGRLKKAPSAYEVAIRCKRVGCRGTVRAYPKAKPARTRTRGRARGRASAAPRPLATARFDAPDADRATARLRFDAADRAAIRRAGGLRLVVEAEGAPAVTRTVALAPR